MRYQGLVSTIVLLACMRAVAADAPASDGSAERPYVTSFEKIKSDFAENEVAADAKYKGKFVTLADRVVSVKKSFLGYPKVMLTADGESHMSATQCTFIKSDEQTKALSGVKHADRIQVLGKFHSLTMGSVFLDECVFVRSLPDPKAN